MDFRAWLENWEKIDPTKPNPKAMYASFVKYLASHTDPSLQIVGKDLEEADYESYDEMVEKYQWYEPMKEKLDRHWRSYQDTTHWSNAYQVASKFDQN